MSKPSPDPIPPANTITQSLVPDITLAPLHGAMQATREVSKARESDRANNRTGFALYLVDRYFEAEDQAEALGAIGGDLVISVPTDKEPSTVSVDTLVEKVRDHSAHLPSVVVGFGGGTTMDSTKAVSNLLTNGGRAENYQGWDLLQKAGVYKVGIPTISGTGAESSRTCVISNARTGAKLGMNSKFSLFNSIILDPSFSESVPRDQFFYTGMDTYLHCIESLNGRFRNVFADALAREALNLVKGVFDSKDMMGFEQRQELMTASCLGGMAIAGSYVGLIHPMSAALSIVFGTHHCVANCIVMRAIEPYYPAEYREFWAMVDTQGVEIPTLEGVSFTQDQLERLESATLIHERPLSNALGLDFRNALGGGRLQELFSML